MTMYTPYSYEDLEAYPCVRVEAHRSIVAFLLACNMSTVIDEYTTIAATTFSGIWYFVVTSGAFTQSVPNTCTLWPCYTE